ncbi:hypothetical protein CK203_054882 [Vitis vinifera]|uniref:Uncharacterized protein n=1 Tax=Vitis vinifera TaxID=29760 RepID=A0A438GAZ8_VITVI|nr:hypothetical protein CK203_054882 [Vitis vinifera]
MLLGNLNRGNAKSWEVLFEEVLATLHVKSGDREPRDGFTIMFWQQCWDFLKHDGPISLVSGLYKCLAKEDKSWMKCLLLMKQLTRARFLMLINGTPTSFFQIFKDLRQGNPLSPHLLVLAIEEATKEEGFISRFQEIACTEKVFNSQQSAARKVIEESRDDFGVGLWKAIKRGREIMNKRTSFNVSNGGIHKESTGRQKALEPHLSRHMDDWEKERVENFPLRFQGQVVRRDENDRLFGTRWFRPKYVSLHGKFFEERF